MPSLARRHRRFTALPQLEKRTLLVPIAAARAVVEEASLWLGVPLPSRYAAGLAHRARRCYAHCPSYRARIDQTGDRGRDTLYVYLRHWLAARLYAERPDLFARLPDGYCTGAELPLKRPSLEFTIGPAAATNALLSNEARLLAGF